MAGFLDVPKVLIGIIVPVQDVNVLCLCSRWCFVILALKAVYCNAISSSLPASRETCLRGRNWITVRNEAFAVAADGHHPFMHFHLAINGAASKQSFLSSACF